MRHTALFLALAVAPTAAVGGEFPAWHTLRGKPRACTAFVGAAGAAVALRGARPATCGLRMQAQSAVEDPPRFSDHSQALMGFVTRAESHAMMLTLRETGAKSQAVALPDSFAAASGLRQETWEKVQVGQGVRCRKHLDQHFDDPVLHRAVDQIHQATLEAVLRPWLQQELVFSAEEVTNLRKVAHTNYVEGTRTMTKLGQLLAARTMDMGYACHSMVTGESGENSEVFRMSQEVPVTRLAEDIGSLDLAKHQLQDLVVETDSELGVWKPAAVLDHSVEFEAETANGLGVAKVIAHARSHAELWRFISDSVFDISYFSEMDSTQDHQHDSMFEIKVLVESAVQAELLHRDLRTFNFQDAELRALNVPVGDESRNVELVSQSKSARRSKVVWRGVGINIRVQTLDEHYLESELSNMVMRGQEDACREKVCQELERRVSLFKFSRDLLHWLFASSSMRHPPTSERITVKLRQ
jgi:hypothetical protein